MKRYDSEAVVPPLTGRCRRCPWTGFWKSARKYKLSGMSLAALCEHNALVAFELDRPQVSFVVVARANLTLAFRSPQTWMML